MTLQETIEFDLREALKNQNTQKRDLLRVLITEITKKSKIASDEEVVKCVKKQIESAKLCNLGHEIALLTPYLPREISDDEMAAKLINVISERLIDLKDTGAIMKAAKEVLGKDFDGKRVSAILKTL